MDNDDLVQIIHEYNPHRSGRTIRFPEFRHDRGEESFLFLHPLNLFKDMTRPDIYQIVHEKRGEINRIAGRYGASHIRIFGSVARHEADEKSDIDFLVELAPGRTLFDLGGLAYDLERLLGRPVDVCTLPLLREPIRMRVASEAVPL